MANYNKLDFRGGMNQFVDPTKVDATTEHYLLVNGRVRENVVSPVKLPLDLTEGLPITGDIQGVYPVGSYQIVFIAGQAWYRNFDPASGFWSKIVGFQMSATAPKIYLETVPASTVNYLRKAVDANNAKAGVDFGTNTVASPRCAVVMDGESQPWVIFPDATARITRTYAEWAPSTDAREYVPAACILPLWFDGVLYCVGKDSYGTYNQIFRSVTGRPLDFVVAVTTSGSKTSTDETIGGAQATAYRPVFDEITSTSAIQASQGAFLVTTAGLSMLVIPDRTVVDLPYGEPVFSNQLLFPVGALNDQCVIDLTIDESADTAVIHYSGIRSFNGVLNIKNEGRNAPFSRWINSLIGGIKQQYAAAVSHDNYGAFALQTRYGPAIVWYDTLTARWVSVDIFRGIGTIKQFSEILTTTERRLFFVTTDNRFYEYGGSTQSAPVLYYVKDFIPEQINSEHAVQSVRLQFSPIRSAGYVQALSIVDGAVVGTKSQQLDASALVVGSHYPMPYPVASDGQSVNVPVQFGFAADAVQGIRAGVVLSWDADADLQSASIETSESTSAMTEQLKARPIGTSELVHPSTIIFIGEDGSTSAARIALNRTIKQLNPTMVIGLGGHAKPDGSIVQVAAQLSTYWDSFRSVGKFYAVPGMADLSTSAGEPFFSALRQSPTRYFVVRTDWADIFMMNAGYNNAGTQIEPDNLTGPTIESSRQMQWLREELSESTKQHKIVVWNSPPYCSADGLGGGIADLQIPLASWGATCHIAARGQLYERSRADDLDWFVAGTGDTPTGTVTTVTEYSQARLLNTAGFLRAKVWPMSIEFSFVKADGTTYDTFMIYR